MKTKIKKTGASFSRGQSRQDYETPKAFISAVETRFGPLIVDLAASKINAKAPRCFTKDDNSLAQCWAEWRGNLWLNPPFDDIAPWAEKCARESIHNRILFLVPASVGSNWFKSHVFNKANVIFLNGRLSFDGIAPFPKDCMLCEFGHAPGFEVWDWKKDIQATAVRQP